MTKIDIVKSNALVSEENEDVAEVSVPVGNAKNGNRPRVLLLDDEINVLLALKRRMRGMVDILPFDEMDNALSYVRSGEPLDLIVSDLHIGGNLSGLFFLREARRHAPVPHRVLLTGDAAAANLMTEDGEGDIQDILLKPCALQDLMLIINQAMEQSARDLKAVSEDMRASLQAGTESAPESGLIWEKKVWSGQ